MPYNYLADIGQGTQNAINMAKAQYLGQEMQRNQQAEELRGQAITGNNQALNRLFKIDPNSAVQLQDFMNSADDRQREQAMDLYGKIGKIAASIDPKDPNAAQKWDIGADYLSQQGFDASQYKGKYTPELQQTAIALSGLSLEALSMGEGPSSVQEYKFYQNLSPENQKTFMSIKRAQPNAKFVDTGPTVRVVDPMTAQPIAEIPKGLPPEKQPKTIRTGKEIEQEFDLNKKLPKARAALTAATAKINLMRSKIEEAKGLVGPFTTGAGAILANLPATDARRLKGVIETIKANIAFNELAEMRANSPTGGAVGQLSDPEREALSATKQALDQAQSGQDIIDALNMLDNQLTGMNSRLINAFNEDFMVGQQPAGAISNQIGRFTVEVVEQ